MLRLRMLAVKNSMKRRLARSPWARTIAGKASSPARISAGGGLISSVKRIGGFGTFGGPPRPLLFLEPGTEVGQGDPVARFKQAQKEFIQVAEMADFDPKAKERSAELREKMKRAPQKIARDPARMREAEREGIAPRVRNFVRQAEQERGREKGRAVEKGDGWSGKTGSDAPATRTGVRGAVWFSDTNVTVTCH